MEKDKDSKLENEILQTEGLGETLHGINRYVHKLESMQNAIFETSLDPPGSNTEKTTLDNKISAAKAYIKREFGSISKRLGALDMLCQSSILAGGITVTLALANLGDSPYSQPINLIYGLSAVGLFATAAFAGITANKYNMGLEYFSDVWRRLKSYEKKLKASDGIPVYYHVQRP